MLNIDNIIPGFSPAQELFPTPEFSVQLTGLANEAKKGFLASNVSNECIDALIQCTMALISIDKIISKSKVTPVPWTLTLSNIEPIGAKNYNAVNESDGSILDFALGTDGTFISVAYGNSTAEMAFQIRIELMNEQFECIFFDGITEFRSGKRNSALPFGIKQDYLGSDFLDSKPSLGIGSVMSHLSSMLPAGSMQGISSFVSGKILKENKPTNEVDNLNTQAKDVLKAVESETPKFCSKCGNPLKPGIKFCGKCGFKIIPVKY